MKIIFGTLQYDTDLIKIDQNSYPQKDIIPNQEIAYLLW